MDSRDRDRQRNARNEKALERILPGALAEGAALSADAAACPDAEILAAFYERSLAPAEVTHWRAHFAACRRCQLSLTALAASDPRPLAEKEVQRLGELVADATAPRATGESALRAKPRKIKLPWFLDPRALAPMAAAAAFVVAVVLTIHTQRVAMLIELQNGVSPQTTIVAENRGEPAAPTLQISPQQPKAPRIAASPAPMPPATEPQYSRGVTAQREQKRAKSEAPASEPTPPAAAQAAPPPPPAPAPVEATNRATAESGASPGENAGATGGAAATPPASAPAEDRTASANAPASGAPAPAAPAPAPAEGRAASSHVRREQGIIFHKDSDTEAPGAVSEIVTVNGAPGYFTATSPDGQTQWRFGRGGLIERTTNASAATTDQIWARQKNPLPAAHLLAGSAPSGTVCWIVGSDGAILRTTDGATWRVISSPASASSNSAAPDWVAVSARDANSATITSADSRTFTTTDAGQSWQQQ